MKAFLEIATFNVSDVITTSSGTDCKTYENMGCPCENDD